MNKLAIKPLNWIRASLVDLDYFEKRNNQFRPSADKQAIYFDAGRKIALFSIRGLV